MTEDATALADRRLVEALAERGARDPRDFYRERLRELKRVDASAYEQAVGYYRDTLIPDVASGSDPLAAWMEYGRRLAGSLAPGRTVTIDATGRCAPYDGPSVDALVLHLPDAKGARALLVSLPVEPSPAQRATYDVLVGGKQRAQSSTM